MLLALTLTAGVALTAKAADPTPAETAARLAQQALADPRSFATVESLTTEVGQRLAGTEAIVRAVAWAKAHLAADHYDDIHTEPFPIWVWVRGVETADVVSPVPQHLAITALGGSVATPASGIEAEIALFRTYADLLAAPPGSLDGKIAVVTQRMVRFQDGSGYGAANPIRRLGPSEAARRGAVAYLHRSLGTDSHRLPHTGALNYMDGVKRIPAAALSMPDADLLERMAARGPVKLRLVLTPSVHAGQSWNTVAEVKGSERPDEVVLIGAHLDSWDLGTGATDDGAGDAIVTEVGRLIAALPQHPRRTLRVVLFGSEEMDFSGPAYAKAHAADAGKIVIASEADFGARPVLAVQLPAGAATSDFGRILGGTLLPPLGAILDRTPALRGGDDVHGLGELGVPVASLRQDGLDYFDTHHTADDTLDKIDPPQLAKAAAVWTAFTYLALESDIDFRKLRAAAH